MAGLGFFKEAFKVFFAFWQGYWMGLSSLNGEKSFSFGCDGTDFSCVLRSHSQSATHHQRQEHECTIWFYKHISRSYQ